MSDGIVTLGRGVAGRWELAVEVEPGHCGKCLGLELAAAARHLVPTGEPLWAQIAPGSCASVRAFLGADRQPVGAEGLLPLARRADGQRQLTVVLVTPSCSGLPH